MSGYSNSDYSIGGHADDESVPTSDAGILAKFGVQDARIVSRKAQLEMKQLRAVNGHPDEAWVPVTNLNVEQGVAPNFVAQAWIEVADAPGEYMSVITLFRTNKGQLECFVPGNTKYLIGVGAVLY